MHCLRTTFQYFAESFDGVKGAFQNDPSQFPSQFPSQCQFDTCSKCRVSSISVSWVSIVPQVLYEGTGRSLFLKLIQQLRQQSSAWDKNKLRSADASAPPLGRVLRASRPARVDPLRPRRPRGAMAEPAAMPGHRISGCSLPEKLRLVSFLLGF